MNLLLVDDEKKFASMLARRLELRGMQVTVCFSGEEALAIEEKVPFEIALLDVKMPGIGGIELKRRLRERYPHMKFIFLTGHGSDADYQLGAKEGDGYLPKPLKIDDLIAALKRLDEEV
jgi:DNA-binding response OmpR family regulator